MLNSDWLSIREAMDFRFRYLPLARKFMETAVESHLIVDLGCGTGSNCRYLRSVLDAQVGWLCIDNDDRTLAAAAKQLPGEQVRFEKGDLATDLTRLPFRDGISVTASAFLDITSPEWLHRFAGQCERIPLLISMTTSGGPIWYPMEDSDEVIGRSLETHRTSDQGCGPAAGTRATELLTSELRSRGCDVSHETSDWRLDDQDRQVIEFLIVGIGRRASEVMPHEQVERWMKIRRDQNRKGVLRLTIPHLDLLSLPQ